MPVNSKSFWSNRWATPAFCVVIGLLMLGAAWLGGNPGPGLAALGVMTALGVVFLVGRRSDTLAGLAGPGRDERWQAIDLRATSLTGVVLITAIIGAFLYELAEGRDGEPYSQLGAIGGLAYLIAIAVLRLRR